MQYVVYKLSATIVCCQSRPHLATLDIWAGSKTSQCLEYLHMAAGANGVPEGIVMANDADLDRCGMLIHQVRLPALFPSLAGARFPRSAPAPEASRRTRPPSFFLGPS
jgi:hypothetical protein